MQRTIDAQQREAANDLANIGKLLEENRALRAESNRLKSLCKELHDSEVAFWAIVEDPKYKDDHAVDAAYWELHTAAQNRKDAAYMAIYNEGSESS